MSDHLSHHMSHLRSHPRYLAGALVAVGAFAFGGITAGNLPIGAAASSPPQSVGGDVAAAVSGASVDSCALVTAAEAAQVLGAEVSKMDNPTQCTYVAMDGSSRAVSVTVPDFAGSRRDFGAGVEQAVLAFDGTLHELSVADESYAIVSPMVSEGLGRRGDTYVVVVLTKANGSTANQVSQLAGLLQTAFARL